MHKTINTRGVRAAWLRVLGLHLVYAWGGKSSNNYRNPEGKRGIDCSGLVGDVLREACPELKHLPDGSVAQLDYLAAQGFERVDYDDAASDKASNVVYVAGFDHGGHDRHIWLLQNGRTMESHTPNGPHSRAGTYSTLANKVQRCFKLS